MSIAVSAVLRRSMWLAGSVSAMCLCVLMIGCAIGYGAIGNLNTVERIAIVTICVMVAGAVIFGMVLPGPAYAIHVTGTGEIRLSVLKNNGVVASGRSGSIVDEAENVVRLLPVSTLWPCLLILHLQHGNGQTSIMTILPDSMSAESFRALLVACRWIMMHRTDDT